MRRGIIVICVLLFATNVKAARNDFQGSWMLGNGTIIEITQNGSVSASVLDTKIQRNYQLKFGKSEKLSPDTMAQLKEKTNYFEGKILLKDGLYNVALKEATDKSVVKGGAELVFELPGTSVTANIIGTIEAEVPKKIINKDKHNICSYLLKPIRTIKVTLNYSGRFASSSSLVQTVDDFFREKSGRFTFSDTLTEVVDAQNSGDSIVHLRALRECLKIDKEWSPLRNRSAANQPEIQDEEETDASIYNIPDSIRAIGGI